MNNYIQSQRAETYAEGFTDTPDCYYDWVVNTAKAIKNSLKLNNSYEYLTSWFRAYRVNSLDNPNITKEYEVLSFGFCNTDASVEVNNSFEISCLVKGENKFVLPQDEINDMEIYVNDMTDALHIYRMLLVALPCKMQCEISNEINEYCWDIDIIGYNNNSMYFDI